MTHIHMQHYNYHGTKHKNEAEFKQRYRSGASEPRFKHPDPKGLLQPEPKEEDGEEDESEPSEPLYSLPIIPES